MKRIYIGYQGIGKSSTVREDGRYIDLESSNFKDDDGRRCDKWYVYYVNTAFDLAEQGHGVFISSHDVVRSRVGQLARVHPEIEVVAIYPSPELRETWLDRLADRYRRNPTYKNRAAWLNALDRFDDNIREIESDVARYGFQSIVIDTTDYRLSDLLNENTK